MKTVECHPIKVSAQHEDCIAVVLINRADAANSLNAEVIEDLSDCFAEVAELPALRAVILSGKGKHFSAGADLHWMRDAARLSFEENIEDADRLTQLFEALRALPVPTIAVAHGSVFGGAVGLVAACDYAVALDSARFCLSESKLGLLPAVIGPYLGEKMSRSFLNRHALTARPFLPEEALRSGLIEAVVTKGQLDEWIAAEIQQLLLAGPKAQGAIKRLYTELASGGWKQNEKTAQAIARLRVGVEGQQGLTSFFEKNSPPWAISMSRSLDIGKLIF